MGGLRLVGYSKLKNIESIRRWLWASASKSFPYYTYYWYRVCGFEYEKRVTHTTK